MVVIGRVSRDVALMDLHYVQTGFKTLVKACLPIFCRVDARPGKTICIRQQGNFLFFTDVPTPVKARDIPEKEPLSDLFSFAERLLPLQHVENLFL